MAFDSESSSTSALGHRLCESALQLGPRKKAPSFHHGCHFGRTIHALCRIHTLLTNGLIHELELVDQPEELFSSDQRREYCVYQQLLQIVPGLEEQLMKGSAEEIMHIADLIQKGSSNVQADDTKSLKGTILDWITPRGGVLKLSLVHNIKADCGFHHERTGALLCPVDLKWSDDEIKEKLQSGELTTIGDQWPSFLFHGYLEWSLPQLPPRHGILSVDYFNFDNETHDGSHKAYKHIFTSPSSVDKEPKATRSGNARIHGMIKVTLASIAYVATQVRFALSSSPIFSRSDLATDSERFYNSILDLFDDVDEQQEVNDLLTWWNRQIFPSSSSGARPSGKDTVHAKIKAKRAAMRSLSLNTMTNLTAGSA